MNLSEKLEVADLYVELGCYEDAIKWFAKGWNDYSKQSNWVRRYVFSLLQMNNLTLSQKLLNEVINEKIEEIKDAYEEECDDDWTERIDSSVIKRGTRRAPKLLRSTRHNIQNGIIKEQSEYVILSVDPTTVDVSNNYDKQHR
jgi:hypothetical protein